MLLAGLFAAILWIVLQPAAVALAATFDVNPTVDAADPTPGDGVCDVDAVTAGNQCSLRAAVQTANALGGSHVIRLTAGTYTLTVAGAGENAAVTGDLDVTATIVIRSADTTPGTVTINGNASDRVFDVRSGGSLTLVGLTVTNGASNGASNGERGAGIRSSGTLTLLGTTVSGNAVSGGGAGARGGGIGVENGTTTLYASTVSGNTSSTRGGGIHVLGAGTLNIFNSVVSGNTASNGSGGGIDTIGTASVTDSTIQGNQSSTGGGIGLVQGGSLTVTRATVSGNTATGLGGGLLLDASSGTGTATLMNVTISGNSATGSGDGLYASASNGSTMTVGLTNVTVGPNLGGGLDTVGITGTLTLNVANTIFAATCTSTGSSTINDLGGNARAAGTGCPGTDQTLSLGSLQDNGGFTQTLALGGGSGAIDFGTGPGCPTTDQRGLLRSLGGTCDSGAYELKVSGNAPPRISTIPSQATVEDGTTGPIAFQIADPDSPNAAGLVLSISANTSPAIPTGSFSFQGSGTSRTLFGTPDPDANGSGSVTVRVFDGADEATTSFTLGVAAVNDAPSFTVGSGQTVNEDAGAQTVTGFIPLFARGPATATDETGQTLTFNVSVTGTTGTLSLAGTPVIDGTNGTLSYQPNPNTNGTATVSVTLSDNGGTANGGQNTSAAQTFTITVNAVNDPPVFALGSNLTVNEDAGPQSLSGFASGLAPGPAAATDESGQTLSPFGVTVTGTTGNLSFTTPPAIDLGTGTLTYQTAPNTNGTATVEVTLSDSGSNTPPNENISEPKLFTIAVNAIDDAPVFTLGGNQTVNEDAGPQTVTGFASGIATGPAGATDEAGQTLSIFVGLRGTTNGLTFTTPPAIDLSTGTLTFQTDPNTNGVALVEVIVSDSGSSTSPNVNVALAPHVTITVNAVNDPPVNTVPPAQTTPGNTPKVFSSANGNAISVADPDAGSGAVQVTLGVTSGTGTLALGSTAGLAVTGNNSGTVVATGTLADLNAGLQGLTFTPTTNVTGTTTLTVTTDDQGSTGGGNLQDVETVQIAVGAIPTATPTPTATATPTGALPPTATFTPTTTTTPTPTWTLTPSPTTTTTPTLTTTPMSTATATASATTTATSTATSTATATTTATATPIPPAPFISPGDDDTDKPRRETAEQRQQREGTNAGNKDDVYTEGNVVEVGPGVPPAYVVIANRDGLVRVDLLCGGDCPTIRVGDYLAADGEKQSEARFEATEVTVTRPR